LKAGRHGYRPEERRTLETDSEVNLMVWLLVLLLALLAIGGGVAVSKFLFLLLLVALVLALMGAFGGRTTV
jgi:hypothetical protein